MTCFAAIEDPCSNLDMEFCHNKICNMQHWLWTRQLAEAGQKGTEETE